MLSIKVNYNQGVELKTTKSIIYIFIYFSLLSCNNEPVANKINKFDKFIQEVKLNTPTTDSGWIDLDKKYEKFISDDFSLLIYQGTNDQKIEYEKLKGKYLFYRYLYLPINKTEKILNQIEGAIEEFKESTK